MRLRRIDGNMHQDLQKRAMDRANALGSRVLCALFAIMALCATPLGTGELFAAESHVYERTNGELREGDLPLRFAMQGGISQALETLEETDLTTLPSVALDDAPGVIPSPASVSAGETGVVPAGPPSPGVRRGLDTGFEARAPPRA